MSVLVTFIHVIICVLLALIILMQSGRGGGLTESFSQAGEIFGAKTNEMLIKATTILSTLFFITCLTLAVLSAQRGKSLMTSQPTSQTSAPVDTASKEIPVGNLPEANPPAAQ